MNLRLWVPLLAGLVTGCAEPLEAPNVVVIVVDTLRSDHVSSYGYARRTTPNIDALAARGRRYADVHSTAPWTLPSHASLFTGKFPFEHGAEARKDADGKFHDAWPLAESQTTLAEVLEAEGYETAAFVANAGYVTERTGLAQGFEEFSSHRMKGDEVVAEALEWIDGTDGPFFAFLNLMDAHRKYNVAPLPDAAERGLPAPPQGDMGELLDKLCLQVLGTEVAPSPELVSAAIDAYDLGIANADRAIGELVAQLERRGLDDDTLYVVVSDHGEYFGEHDLAEHSKDVYEPALRIPLVVVPPRSTVGKVESEPVSIADVPRFVLAELPDKLRRHVPRFPGSGGERGLVAELHFTRSKDMNSPWGARFDREREVMLASGWKLIVSSDGRNELYHLPTDPDEQRNLYQADPERSAKLVARLRGLIRHGGVGDAPAPRELTDEERRILAETGYADAPQDEQR